jgi:hypothetical protein
LVTISLSFLLVACSRERPDLSYRQSAATTRGHQVAAAFANDNSCGGRYISDTQAGLWGTDPDCAPTDDNSRGDCDAHFPPDGFEGAWSGSLSWACRNWDHFTHNNFVPDNNLSWLATMESLASSAVTAYNNTLAAGHPDIQYLRLALRRSYDACHYAIDHNQCGHEYGNMVCDPNASEPSQPCVNFVYDHNFPIDPTALSGLAIHDGCRVSGYSSAASYAAAERYIRHHSRGQVLDQPEWVNHCPYECPTGDADGPADDACQLGGFNSDNNLCLALLQQTCAGIQTCTPRTCAELGATCGNPPDQCGGTLSCGSCPPLPWTCNPSYNCECVGSAIGQCGWTTDTCGGTVFLGSCPLGSDCVGNFCIPTCTPCVGQTCGFDLHCGSGIYCGGCAPGWTCNAYGNCECAAVHLCFQGCGDFRDECGSWYSCVCPAHYTCCLGGVCTPEAVGCDVGY